MSIIKEDSMPKGVSNLVNKTFPFLLVENDSIIAIGTSTNEIETSIFF